MAVTLTFAGAERCYIPDLGCWLDPGQQVEVDTDPGSPLLVSAGDYTAPVVDVPTEAPVATPIGEPAPTDPAPADPAPAGNDTNPVDPQEQQAT